MMTQERKGRDAEVERLREGLAAGIRAAKMALFIIEKRGVEVNDSWRAGLKKDLEIAERAADPQQPT